ncbi:S-layer family protein [Bacillus oleivorans]|uniref:S-layer family protein n=1 Tax=Bacillus oleivorans TaxID=1448271 RepID=A0A285CJZ5_9BACI|nr:S-layer homology domain-containing protein [Bacillus oleivorans]SNX67348.1 S-layer family protein [Bacillus oleivorans]
MAYQPKSYRKFIATAATATLVASAVAPAAAATQFTDVSEKYAEAVQYLVDNKITVGMSPTKFGVAENIIRADAAVWLAAALGLDTTNAPDAGFTDVPARAEGAANALKAAGITSGKTATTFGANDTLTRGEMAIWLQKAYDLTGEAELKFTDVASQYQSAVKALVANEITSGKTPTSFGTDQEITRGDLAIFLYKVELLTADPKVVSVSAINAKQVEVKFNKTVDKATAEDEANYKVNDTVLSTFDAGATAALQSDKKSVVITFTNSQNKTSFDLTVSNVKTEDKAQTVPSFKGVVTVNDATAPTVAKVEYTSAGKVVVTFSEPMNTGVTPIVRVNGTPVAANFVAGSQTQVEATVTVAKGATATIYVAGAKDSVNNEMAIYNGSFVAPNDSEGPAIASVTQLGHNKLKVVLTEALGTTAGYELANNEFKFLLGSTVYSSTAAVKDTNDTSGKTYEVTFTEADIYGATNPVNSQTVTLILDKDAIKDVYGNGNAAFNQSFTFNADKTGPSLVSGKLSDDKQTFELTFNEEFLGTDPDVDESKIIITDANGVRFGALAATTVVKAGLGNEKVLVVDFVSGTGTIPNGTYTVQLQAGAVKDAKANLSSAGSVTIVVGSGNDSSKPTATLDIENVTDAPQSGVNKFVIDFSEEVTASALNLGNYLLDGRALPSGTVAYFNTTDKNSVTIELPANSVNIGSTATGTDALLSVSNVADKAGNVLNPTNLTVKIGDNTPANLVSAQKLGNTLVLTFDEALHADAADAAIAEVLANYTIKSGSSTVVAGTGAATAALVAGDSKKVQITFSNTTGTNYDPAQTITVTTKSGGDLKDSNGLAVKADVTVTAN